MRIAALLIFAALLPTAHADALTGRIQGRIQNSTNGLYLNHARILLEGTALEVFTNEYGEYTLDPVRAGTARITAFFTGLERQTVSVDVTGGQAAIQDVQLKSIPLSSGLSEGETVVLDQMVVVTQRETNAANIAANEQRFASNIKVVMASAAFGDVTEGNVGEFVKFLPGITVNYVAADVRTMSVRGFADAFTTVYMDGFRLANASSGNAQRAFEFEQVSINNVARVEVTKVPTPDLPADVLGGSVNLISRNAFERAAGQLRFRTYASVNSEDLNPFQRSPGPGRAATFKVLPGLDFDYILPLTKTFGLVVTGLTSNQFNEQHRSQMVWNSAQAGASLTNPFLQQYTVQDGPKDSFRDSFSVKADWRLPENQSLSATFQYNFYLSLFGNRNLNWDVGASATPSTRVGPALTWGRNFTSGASGQGSVRQGTSFRDKMGATEAANLGYRLQGRLWEIQAGFSDSVSKSWFRDTDRGHFSEVRTTLLNTSRVAYQGIDQPRPASLAAYDAAGTQLDPHNLGGYRIDTVRTQPVNARDEFRSLHLDVKRELDFLPFNLAVKTGVLAQVQTRDIRKSDVSWDYVGPDGQAQSGDEGAAPYLDTRYGANPYWGFQHIQWPDPYLLWDTFTAHPNYFGQSSAQQLNAVRFAIQNSQSIRETTPAGYVEFEGRFINNRLKIITGVRFEQTEDRGRGPSSKGPGTTVAEVGANWTERGLEVDRSYHGFYPSLHLNFNLNENLIVRAAYARTFGRPDFGNILPLARVNDSANLVNDGIGDINAHSIIVNNSGLKPWQADNWDLSLEYYLPQGGQLAGGVFRKDLTNFWSIKTSTASAADLASLNLDPAYVGYALQTTVNAGAAQISGMELNYTQPLTFLPGLGRTLSVFANGTKLYLDGHDTAAFQNFINESASWGLTFSKKPVVVMLKWNYRGRQIRTPQTGAVYGNGSGFYEYYAPRINADVNMEYQFTQHFAFFANARNVFNIPQQLERYNHETPAYAHFYNQEEYGVQLALGIEGTF